MSTSTRTDPQHLAGNALYGDDFTQDEIHAWFEDEREGYANLGEDKPGGGYSYHAVNILHGFRHLPKRGFRQALGVGAAFGYEFEPIADRLREVTILEPSQKLVGTQIGSVTPNYVVPDPSGIMPFDDGTFDLVLCFGTLHHIPNVSTVMSEIARVTEAGGYVLIREPIISMGDWRNPRTGLTKRERGIPLKLLDQMFREDGLEVVSRRFCFFPGTPRLARLTKTPAAYNSRVLTALDAVGSVVTRPLYRYHAAKQWQKVRPTNAFYVARKAG